MSLGQSFRGVVVAVAVGGGGGGGTITNLKVSARKPPVI